MKYCFTFALATIATKPSSAGHFWENTEGEQVTMDNMAGYLRTSDFTNLQNTNNHLRENTHNTELLNNHLGHTGTALYLEKHSTILYARTYDPLEKKMLTKEIHSPTDFRVPYTTTLPYLGLSNNEPSFLMVTTHGEYHKTFLHYNPATQAMVPQSGIQPHGLHDAVHHLLSIEYFRMIQTIRGSSMIFTISESFNPLKLWKLDSAGEWNSQEIAAYPFGNRELNFVSAVWMDPNTKVEWLFIIGHYSRHSHQCGKYNTATFDEFIPFKCPPELLSTGKYYLPYGRTAQVMGDKMILPLTNGINEEAMNTVVQYDLISEKWSSSSPVVKDNYRFINSLINLDGEIKINAHQKHTWYSGVLEKNQWKWHETKKDGPILFGTLNYQI